MRGSRTERLAALIREALATPALRQLQLSWGLVSIASWSFTIVLAVYAYGEGGATAVGVAAVTRMLPAALAAPVAGLLADQRSRRDVLLALALLRGAALAVAAAAIAVGAPFALIVLLAAIFTMLSTAQKPAQAGLLTTLVSTPTQLGAANALWSAGDNGGFLLGSLIGGVLVGVAEPAAGMAAVAVIFLAAAGPIARLPRDPVPTHRQPFPGATAGRELALGAQTVRADRRLRTLVILSSATTAVHGALDVLIVVLALDLLVIGDAGVGWLSAAWGAGGLAGGVAALSLMGRTRPAVGLIGGTLLVSLPLCALSVAPSTALAIAVLMMIGVGSSIIETGVLTFIQRLTADEALARVFAVQESGLQLTTGLGAAAAPAVVAAFGAEGALTVAGLLLPLLVLGLWRPLAGLEAGTAIAPDLLTLVRSHDLFAPLPLVVQESLVHRLEAVSVPAGSAVIREGEMGDSFFLVESGTLEVSRHGRTIATQSRGDGFGEIALVRDVPRTATVVATEDVRLLSLDRESFLAAVSGQRRSSVAAESLVAAREARPAEATLDAA